MDGVWYHGRSVKSTTFDLKYVGKGHDQEGPGFYFSRNKELAEGYAAPNGIIMTVALHPRKLLPIDRQVKRDTLEKLIRMSPILEESLENWGESPKPAMKAALDAYSSIESAKSACESICVDFYSKHEAEYLKALVSLGFDGSLAEVTKANIVIYNPDVIEVLEVEDYKPDATANVIAALKRLI